MILVILRRCPVFVRFPQLGVQTHGGTDVLNHVSVVQELPRYTILLIIDTRKGRWRCKINAFFRDIEIKAP